MNNIYAVIENNGDISIKQNIMVDNVKSDEICIRYDNLKQTKATNFEVEDFSTKYKQSKNRYDSKNQKNIFYITNKNNQSELHIISGSREFNTFEIKYKYKNAFIGYKDYDVCNIKFIGQGNIINDGSYNTIELRGKNLDRYNTKAWVNGFSGISDINRGSLFVSAFTRDDKDKKKIDQFSEKNHISVIIALNKGLIHPKIKKDLEFNKIKSNMFQENGIDSENGKIGKEHYARGEESMDYRYLVVGICLLLFFSIKAFLENRKRHNLVKNIDDIEINKSKSHNIITFGRYLPAINYVFTAFDKNYSTDNNKVIFGIIVKWYIEGSIDLYDFDKKTTGYKMLKKPEISNKLEEALYNSLSKAYFDKDIKESVSLMMHYVRNMNELSEFRKISEDMGREYLLANNYLNCNDEKEYILTKMGREEVDNTFAYRNYVDRLYIDKMNETLSKEEITDILNFLMYTESRTKTILDICDYIEKNYPDYYYFGIEINKLKKACIFADRAFDGAYLQWEYIMH